MKLHGILLLGNDMIIPRDVRDFGNVWGNETQVTPVSYYERQKRIEHYITYEVNNRYSCIINIFALCLGCSCTRYWNTRNE